MICGGIKKHVAGKRKKKSEPRYIYNVLKERTQIF